MSKQMKTKLLVLTALFVLGGGDFAATWVRGEHRKAFEGLGLIVVIALLLLLAGRSERLRRQLFDTDERSDAIGLFAGAWAGFALFFVIFVTFLVEFARGHSGEPYYWLSGLYVGAYVVFAVARSFRR
jgi:hypothetical protein